MERADPALQHPERVSSPPIRRGVAHAAGGPPALTAMSEAVTTSMALPRPSARCQAFLDDCAVASAQGRQALAVALGRRAEAGDAEATSVLEELQASDTYFGAMACIWACSGRGTSAYPYLLQFARDSARPWLQAPALKVIVTRMRSQEWSESAWQSLLPILLDGKNARHLKRLLRSGRKYRQVRQGATSATPPARPCTAVSGCINRDQQRSEKGGIPLARPRQSALLRSRRARLAVLWCMRRAPRLPTT